MRGNPAQHVRLGEVLLEGPSPLGEGTSPDPYLHVMHVFVAQFAPETHLRAKYFVLVIVVLDESADVLVVEVHPSLVVPVGDSEVVSHTHVEVEGAVLRDDDVELD